MHKKLTFSEFCGDSYERDVSHKFVEYLKLSFRTSSHLVLIHHFDSQITSAKESRHLYTLDPIPDLVVAPIPPSAPTVAVPQSTVPTIPIPKTAPTPVPGFTGPIQTAQKPSTRPRPLPTRVDGRVQASAVSPTNASVPQVKAPRVQLPEVDVSQIHTQANSPQAITPPPNAPQVNAALTGPNASVIVTTPQDTVPLSVTQVPDDCASDGGSYTSTLPEIFDTEMDDSGPPATGPWMIIDHLTGEVIVDDDQSTPPAPTVPTVQTISTGPTLAGVEASITQLGDPYLIETPPTLLSEDEDVRPQWLMTAINAFLRFVPCFGSLGKVIDLYLAQEARLGYPELVCTLLFFFEARSPILTVILVHSTSTSV